MTWTDEITNRHRVLFVEGKTHSQIARILTDEFGRKITRNASIGKAHRMGYPSRRGQLKTNHRPRKAPPIPKRGKEATEIKRKLTEPMPMSITLLELTDFVCKWPVSGTKENTRFCGWGAELGSSYCPYHRERSLEPKRAKRKRDFTQYSNWLSQRVIMAGG